MQEYLLEILVWIIMHIITQISLFFDFKPVIVSFVES